MHRNAELTRALNAARLVEAVTGTLPPPVTAAMTGLATLDSALVAARTRRPGATLHAELVEELLDAAPSGTLPDIGKRAAAAVAEGARRDLEEQLLQLAVTHAEPRCEGAITGAADELLELLQERFAAVLAKVREVGPLIAGVDTSDPVMLDDEALGALREMRRAQAEYDAVMGAYHALLTIMPRPEVDDGFFAEVRNAPAVWGSRVAGRHQNDWRPWPTEDRLAKLLWLAGAAREYAAARPDAWLPSPADRDDAMSAYISERRSVRAA
jgi:hypothetical protein